MAQSALLNARPASISASAQSTDRNIPNHTKELTFPEGFTDALGPLIADIARQRTSMLKTADRASVHALRCAIRRTRSAFLLFAPVLADGDVAWLRDELKRIEYKLGETRDLDVLLTRFEEHQGHYHPETCLEDAISGVAIKARDLAGEGAIEELRSARSTALVEGLERWIAQGTGSVSDWADRSLFEHAASWTTAADAKVRERGVEIERLGHRARHRLRRRVNTLRYNTELMLRLRGHVDGDAYTASLTDVHHALGELNDATVGRRLSKRLSAPNAARPLRNRRDPKSVSRRRKLKTAWKMFMATAPSFQGKTAAGQA